MDDSSIGSTVKNGPNLSNRRRGSTFTEDRTQKFYQHRLFDMSRVSIAKDRLDNLIPRSKCIQFHLDEQNWIFNNTKRSTYKNGSASRVLYVYSSLCDPVRVGEKITDLIKVVPHVPLLEGHSFYEPENIHYIPVRNKRIEIIETEISETTENELAKFASNGISILTLHFRRKNYMY